MNNRFSLKVQALARPLDDVLSIRLGVPQDLRETFAFIAGQHLSVQRSIDGEVLRRSYSIHACPHSWDTLDLSIRRIPGGRMSNHLFEELKVGESLDVSPPAGRFVANTQPDARRTWFLFAAGTGITPIWSMAQSVLRGEPKSFVRLLYGNKRQDSILFAQEIQSLQAQFGARMVVEHTLSGEASPSLWSWSSWQGMRGRIGVDTLNAFINKHPAPAQDCQYRICGPGAMNRAVQTHLMTLGVEAERIGFEQFAAGPRQALPLDELVDTQCEIQRGSEKQVIAIAKGQTLLEGLRAHRVEVPSSCESGVCGTCVAQLEEGEVQMAHHAALDTKDLENHKILVCQARAKSTRLKLRLRPL